jgi:hypothetical protein
VCVVVCCCRHHVLCISIYRSPSSPELPSHRQPTVIRQHHPVYRLTEDLVHSQQPVVSRKMAHREPTELHMPIPTPAAPSTTAAALGRRLSRDKPTFTIQPNLFRPRGSISKPPRTPSPRSNPEPSTSPITGIERSILSLHHSTSSAPLVGPAAPDSPPFNMLSPEEGGNTEVHDDDGIIHVENPRTRSLSNALNLTASPPTPAPSPIPREDASLILPSWQTAHASEDDFLRSVQTCFMRLSTPERQRFLAEILNICGTEELRFVNACVKPRLKVDFLKMLPMEVGLRV